jgi:predicted alpha/beta hydrolase family esterase
MNEISFLIIHGLHGSGSDHWQTWLSNELKNRNYQVTYPVFSKFHNPNKEVWLDELSEAIEAMPKHTKKIVVTHSLGGVLWHHYAALQKNKIADHVILVAPPSPAVVLPEAKSFFPVPLKGSNLTQSADKTIFIHSSNDPYCSLEDALHYHRLNLPTITFPNMGHINTASGHDKWPWILDLCLKIAEKDYAYSH